MNEGTVFRNRLQMHGGWIGLLLSSALLAGCTVETAEPEPSTTVAERPKLPEAIAASRRARGMGIGTPLTDKERTHVLEFLRLMGYPASDIIFFAEDAVLVGGDILLDGPTILKDSLSDTKKGYWFGGEFRFAHLGRLADMAVVPVTDYPDSDWQAAFASAAQDFTDHTALHPVPGDDPTVIRIWIDQVAWPADYQGFTAWTEPGHNVAHPGRIYININYNGLSGGPGPCHVGSTYALPFEVKRRVATHELMHAFGFAHVGDGAWISGTEQAGSNYPSVMYAGACLNEQPYYTTGLSDDDIDSVYAMYH